MHMQQQQMQQQQQQLQQPQQQNLNPNTTAHTETTNQLQPQQISGTDYPQSGQSALSPPQQEQQSQMNFQTPVIENTNNSENHNMDYDTTTVSSENVQGT